MKKRFTTERWERALTAVFVRSIQDFWYRELCVTDPRAAVEVVAPWLDLPREFHFRFATHAGGLIHSYLLPPSLGDDTNTLEYAKELIAQNNSGLTHPPTQGTGGQSGGTQTTTPNGDGDDDDEDEDDLTESNGGGSVIP